MCHAGLYRRWVSTNPNPSHARESNLSQTEPCQGQDIFKNEERLATDTSYCLFLDIWTFPFGQNWASLVQFSVKSESIFLSAAVHHPPWFFDAPTHDEDHPQDISLTLLWLAFAPTQDEDHSQDISPFVILWSCPLWFFDALTHDEISL